MGSERVIEIGQPGFNFLPFVSGHRRLPPPGGPFWGPELTMLHVLTGNFDLSIHEARMFALVSIAAAHLIGTVATSISSEYSHRDTHARSWKSILAARGIAIVDQVRTRINECTDPDQLNKWATRAATSATIDEVFAS